MKNENIIEDVNTNEGPKLYTGVTTKKWDTDFLPVCIMVVSLVLFVIVALNMKIEVGSFKIGNYLYYTDNRGKVQFLDGAAILFFMVVAFICYLVKLHGWAFCIETIGAIFTGCMLNYVSSQKNVDLLGAKYHTQLIFECIFVMASEIAMIWNLYIQLRKKKGR